MDDAFLDKLFANLPSDAKAAIFELASRLEGYVNEVGNSSDTCGYYVSILSEFSSETGVFPGIIQIANAKDSVSAYSAIRRALQNELANHKKDVLRGSVRNRVAAWSGGPGFTKLKPSERAAIEHSLGKIEAFVKSSALSQAQKDYLLGRISELRQEIAKTATNTQTALGCITEVATYAASMPEDMVPQYLQSCREAVGMLVRAKGRDEGIPLLPASDTPLMLDSNDGG